MKYCHSFSSTGRKLLAATGVSLLLFPLLNLFTPQEWVHAETPASSLRPFTVAEAKAIQMGEIRMKPQNAEQANWVDASLVNNPPMDPNADDDGDGIPNGQELQVYEENGIHYLHYNSHPKLADTDGDGISDPQDEHRLSWDVCARDGIFFQELSYRDDDYVRSVLSSTNPDAELQLYEGNIQYRRMQRELAPYWILKDSWHMDSGLHALLFEFSNHNYPYLEDASAHMLAFRGTKDPRQFLTDISIIFGGFPTAARDTQMLADHIANKGYRNISVCGHSLGGYLSQVFMARSLGLEYGKPQYHNGTNRNVKDPNKKFNDQIRHEFTFNALRILSPAFNSVPLEYYHVSKAIDEHDPIPPEHYRVSNDAVIRNNYPDKSILIGDSEHGHRSISFFEDRFQKTIPAFVSGWRKGMSPEPGIQNPGQTEVFFVPPTRLELRNESGETLRTRVVAIRNEDIASGRFNLNQILLPEYEAKDLKDPKEIKIGETNILTVQRKQFNIVYRFVDEKGNLIEEQIIQTPYQTPYKLPDLPKHKDPHQSYVCANDSSLPQIPAKEITRDQVLTVPLKSVEKQIQTQISLFDQADKDNPNAIPLKVLNYQSPERDQESTRYTLQEKDLPEGYALPDPAPTFTAGKNHKVYLDKKRFSVTIRYVVAGEERVLRSDTLNVPYGDTPEYSLNVPDGYEIQPGYVFELPNSIREERTLTIPLVRKAAETKTLRILIQHDSKTLTETVASFTREEVEKGNAQFPLTLPEHPHSAQDWVYLWEDENFEGSHTLTLEEWETGADLIYPVKEQQNPHQVAWAIVLEEDPNGEPIKTGSSIIQPGDSLKLELPQDKHILYSWVNSLPVPDKSYPKDQPLRVLVRKQKRLYPVQVVYHSSDPERLWAEEEENLLMEFGEEHALEDRRFYQNESERQAGIYYSIRQPAPIIRLQDNMDLSQKPIRFQVELERHVPMYQIHLVFIDQEMKKNPIVHEENVSLPAGTVPMIQLPKPPQPKQEGDFDGVYELPETFQLPAASKDETWQIPLERTWNQYSVQLQFLNEAGKEILLHTQIVQSGNKPIWPDLAKLLKGYELAKPIPELPTIDWRNAKTDTPLTLSFRVIPSSHSDDKEDPEQPEQPDEPGSPEQPSKPGHPNQNQHPTIGMRPLVPIFSASTTEKTKLEPNDSPSSKQPVRDSVPQTGETPPPSLLYLIPALLILGSYAWRRLKHTKQS